MKKVLVMSMLHTGTEFVTEYLAFMDIMPLQFVKPTKGQILVDQKSRKWASHPSKDTFLDLFNSTHEEFVTHPSKHIVGHIHIDHTMKENLRSTEKYAIMEYAKENCKVVIPLRHPIENAISHIGRYKDIEMSYCEDKWDILFDDIIPNYDIFWVDINIEKRKRFKMMEALNEFIGRLPIDDIKFHKYVSEWKPINHEARCDLMKEAYHKQNKLPEGHDFSCLDNAIEWYNNKKVELDKLYE